MTGWEWITAGFSLNGVIQALGLGALAVLFATDRILTKGQHLRRIADLVAQHAALIAEKDLRYAEMKESRDYYREARLEERSRAEKVTDTLGETAVEYAKLTNHVLESLPKPEGP